MAEKVKVCFDPEADYFNVQFREVPDFMRTKAHDALMERVDEQGHGVGKWCQEPFVAPIARISRQRVG